jgi:Tectonin domain
MTPSRCILLTLAFAALAACSPAGRAMSPRAPADAAAAAQLQTPLSVSPAKVPAPPMPAGPVPPASSMTRSPRSSLSMTGWTQLPGSAVQLAAAANFLYALSTQPGGYGQQIYQYNGPVGSGSWSAIPGSATRIAMSPYGQLWAVNSAGGIYAYDSGHGSWSTIAGGASDISIASDGSVYVISNQGGGPYGYGIWHYVNGTWTQLPGAAVRIAASWDTASYPGASITPGGFYVVNTQQSVFYYDLASGFHQVPGSAYQVAPTRSGGLFALGVPPGPYGEPIYYRDLSAGAWTQQPGAANSIATDGVRVFVTNTQGAIYYAPVNVHDITGSGIPLTGPSYGPGSGTSGGWGPPAVASALQFPVQNGFDGSGFTVAIPIDSAVDPNDIATYLSYFAIPRTGRSIDAVYVDGASSLPTADQRLATLAVETVAGLAPGAGIRLYVTPDLDPAHLTDAFNQLVLDPAVSVVVIPYGLCESSASSGQSGVNAAITYGTQHGITFVASSGDRGATACVNWPASYPDVAGVGGTETQLPANALTSSTAWSDASGASGGGMSNVYRRPGYQVGVVPGNGPILYRAVPDVAMPAASAAFYRGGWSQSGGTAWSASQFAALLTEVDQYCNRVGYDVSSVYFNYTKSGGAAFIDVTGGTNSYNGGFGYSAQPGYDNASGLGVPLGMPFAQTACTNRVNNVQSAARRPVLAVAERGPAQPVAVDVVPRVRDAVDAGPRAPGAVTGIQLVLRPGPSLASDEQAVIAVLRAAGFTVTRTFANHLVVDADGPSSAVEALFATRLHDVTQGRYGRRYMPVSGATIPASLAPYVAGVNLDDVVLLGRL